MNMHFWTVTVTWISTHLNKRKGFFLGRCIIFPCPSCIYCFCLFYVLFAPCVPNTSHSSSGGAAHKIHDQSAFVCVCVCVWMSHGVSNTTRTSLSDLPHLLSRQVLSTPGGDVSSSLCLSVTLSLSLSHLLYTQTACTDVPLSQNPEWPLHRHLSERGVSGIIHSAGTNDGEEQGQLWLLRQGKSSRATGVTSFSSLILHQ